MTAVPAPAELVPPPEPKAVMRVGLIGLGLSAAAAALGAVTPGDGLPILNTVRLLLAAAAAVVAGSAISMRPGMWKVWALAAGTGSLAAIAGVPEHWDSGRLLARCLTGLAAGGAALAAMKPVVRYSVVTVLVVFHFGGILCATTNPDPSPWLSNQVLSRVYMPYLSFTYMRNAYHFYSPEPGPASELFVLVNYELDETDPATGKKKRVSEWKTFPRRDEHMKDPLGLTYYRRLSLTEMVAPTFPDSFFPASMRQDAQGRRGAVAVGIDARERIPIADEIPASAQYRVPRPDISRYLLPSYAHHWAVEYSGPGRTVVSTKVYRAEHRIVPTDKFVEGSNPYDPRTFWVYFVGDYDRDGKLIDPQDPMLYWAVPVVSKPGGPAPGDKQQVPYDDYLTKHSGFEFKWERMRQ
jgi:hypothetical protein